MLYSILCCCVSYYEANGLGAGERNAGREKGEELILEMKRQKASQTSESKITDKVQM